MQPCCTGAPASRAAMIRRLAAGTRAAHARRMTNDQIPQSLPSAPPPAPYPYPPAPYQAAPVSAPAPVRDQTTTMIAVGLFVAAVVMFAGLITKSWFTVPGGGIGLTGVEACMGERCMSISLSDIPKLPGDIPLFGYLGLLAGLAAIGCAAAMGGMLLSNKAHKIPLKAFNAVFGIAAFSTTMFLMRIYSDDPKHASFGWSGFTAIGALIVIGALTKTGVTPRAKVAS
jgi:hypothetical protein